MNSQITLSLNLLLCWILAKHRRCCKKNKISTIFRSKIKMHAHTSIIQQASFLNQKIVSGVHFHHVIQNNKLTPDNTIIHFALKGILYQILCSLTLQTIFFMGFYYMGCCSLQFSIVSIQYFVIAVAEIMKMQQLDENAASVIVFNFALMSRKCTVNSSLHHFSLTRNLAQFLTYNYTLMILFQCLFRNNKKLNI
eukprot:TRINITY_DN2328_c1_g1_i1.p1 TRINITY_DN2328_c1_g1~~TRINITY_DN2328_c1_g1_i1.p1  ORF type:complete len:195 (-),score=-13.49 TRINITY_DN2328_c1_g1_i1:296-880(-)